jgi:hypothetical protein
LWDEFEARKRRNGTATQPERLLPDVGLGTNPTRRSGSPSVCMSAVHEACGRWEAFDLSHTHTGAVFDFVGHGGTTTTITLLLLLP